MEGGVNNERRFPEIRYPTEWKIEGRGDQLSLPPSARFVSNLPRFHSVYALAGCPGGKRRERNKLPFESCAFFSSTLSFLALVLAFLTLPFVFAVMVSFFRLFPPFAVFIIPLLSSHFEPSHFLILFPLPLSYSFSLLNFLIPVFHYLS